MELVKVNIKLPEETKDKLVELAGGERSMSAYVNDMIIRKFNLHRSGATAGQKFILDMQSDMLELHHDRKMSGVVYAQFQNAIDAYEKELSKMEKGK